MPLSPKAYRVIPRIFLACTLLAIVIWALVPGYDAFWDLHVYRAAILSLRAGHDPYEDGIAIQKIFHATLAQQPSGAPTPFTYVYSPITLPLLGLVAKLPLHLSAFLYLALYVVGSAAAIWVGMWAEEDTERRVFAFLAPVAIFFPGLLENDVLFSGNMAYVLHGAALLAAWRGWTKNRWSLFYLVVLSFSCYKAPMLYLLALPVLSARKQWLPAGITGAAGVALFAVQPHLWPQLFHHYMEAVELQFSYNHDFSASPAGLLANALYDHVSYQTTSIGFYLFTILVCGAILLHLRAKYLAGCFTLKEWAAYVTIGVALLNPRIMEYDIAPLTVMMALILWRFFVSVTGTRQQTILGMALVFAALNAIVIPYRSQWRLTACLTLVGVFAAGSWTLFAKVRKSQELSGPVSPANPLQPAIS